MSLIRQSLVVVTAAGLMGVGTLTPVSAVTTPRQATVVGEELVGPYPVRYTGGAVEVPDAQVGVLTAAGGCAVPNARLGDSGPLFFVSCRLQSRDAERITREFVSGGSLPGGGRFRADTVTAPLGREYDYCIQVTASVWDAGGTETEHVGPVLCTPFVSVDPT